MSGKTMYLCLQYDYMERFYDKAKVPAYIHEIMRANNFCVKALSKVVAFDFRNKNYNLYLKRTPVSPSLELLIMRSRHVMCGMKAKIEMEGLPEYCSKKLSCGVSEEDEVMMLEGILAKCLVFTNHQPHPIPIDRDYFWKCVHPPIGVGSECDRDKIITPYTDHELELLERLTGESITAIEDSNDNNLSNGSRDESLHGNDNHHYLGNVGILEDDQDVDEDELTSKELAKRASDALKSLGNVCRRDLEKSATRDQFVLGKIMSRKSL